MLAEGENLVKHHANAKAILIDMQDQSRIANLVKEADVVVRCVYLPRLVEDYPLTPLIEQPTPRTVSSLCRGALYRAQDSSCHGIIHLSFDAGFTFQVSMPISYPYIITLTLPSHAEPSPLTFFCSTKSASIQASTIVLPTPFSLACVRRTSKL